MKKTMTVILAAMILLSLCACGGAGSKTSATVISSRNTVPAAEPVDQTVYVGYGQVDITPDYSVPLSGYGNTSRRMSTGYETRLYATCIAYSDGDTTALVYITDLGNANAKVVSEVRSELFMEYGIPEACIMIAATHTHSAPDQGNTAEPSIVNYRFALKNWLLEAAKLALEDRKLLTGIYHGTIAPQGLNFVRHYTTEAGVVKGDNFNDLVKSPYTGHTHDADNELQVVKMTRQGGEDVVLCNWQSHPHRGGGSKNTMITADIVGIMREYVQQQTGCKFAYYTGASGNINPSSRIASENITANYTEQGKALGSYALQVLDGEMQPLSATGVQITGKMYAGEVNHSEDDLLSFAQVVQQVWVQNNNFTEAVILANSYGINSPYHAGAIISKVGLGKTYNVEMHAISVGDFAMVTAPYEMFDENGKYIKENSPFDATIVITCCNNSIGYIPSMEGYENNCYGANTGKFVAGTGELLAEEYIKMLDKLFNTK